MPKEKKNYTVLVAIIGAVGIIVAALITGYYSNQNDKKGAISIPTVDIKSEGGTGNNIQPITVSGDSNKVEVDQSRNKKTIAGDAVGGNKTEYKGDIIREGDNIIVNEKPPRSIDDTEKNFLDQTFAAGDTAFIYTAGTEEAMRYADQFGNYLERKRVVVYDMIDIQGISPGDGRRYYYEKARERVGSIHIYSVWK